MPTHWMYPSLVSVANAQIDIPPGFELVTCPGCDSASWTLARIGADWALDPDRQIQIVRCVSCGLHYTNPRPKLAELGKYYPDEYGPYRRQRGEIERDSVTSTALRLMVLRNAYAESSLRPKGWRRALATAVSIFKPAEHWGFAVEYRGKGRVLDFGCGNGTFLRRMRALGWDATGIDFSESAVKAVRESGLKALQGTLPHPDLAPKSFDLVTMRSALEHLPDPREVLCAIRDLLDDDGLLVIQVPNFASWEIEYFGDAALTLDLPRHLLHMTPATLNDLLVRCGLRVLSLKQICRASWLRKSLAQIERRGPRPSDALLRIKPICQLAALRAQRHGRGNELIAVATRASSPDSV